MCRILLEANGFGYIEECDGQYRVKFSGWSEPTNWTTASKVLECAANEVERRFITRSKGGDHGAEEDNESELSAAQICNLCADVYQGHWALRHKRRGRSAGLVR